MKHKVLVIIETPMSELKLRSEMLSWLSDLKGTKSVQVEIHGSCEDNNNQEGEGK